MLLAGVLEVLVAVGATADVPSTSSSDGLAKLGTQVRPPEPNALSAQRCVPLPRLCQQLFKGLGRSACPAPQSRSAPTTLCRRD